MYFASQTGRCFHKNDEEQATKQQNYMLLLWAHLLGQDPILALSHHDRNSA